jgi:hypothetical protein
MATVVVQPGTTSYGTLASADSLYILGGGQTITTGSDQSALANGLVAVELPKAFVGQASTSGAPLYVEVTGYIWYGAGGGDLYYKGKDTTDATPIAYAVGGGHFHFVDDGTITNFHLSNGTATISGPCIVTNLYVFGGTGTLLDDTSTDPTILLMGAGPSGVGGSLTTERGFTTGTVNAGSLTIDADTNTITTLNCNGSYQNSKTVIKECGTITTANLYGHIPDTTNMSRPLTITNTNINVTLPNAQAFLDNPLITFTNTPARFGSDGRPI